MSHYAKIENNIVVNVIVANNDYIKSIEGEWVQTSYNTVGNEHVLGGEPLRGNFAGVGYVYDRENDVFYAPQPYPSWILNTTKWVWEAPIECPTDGKIYTWVESELNWVELK